MTVEAALVMPLFLFLLFHLISAVELICMDMRLDAALHEVGREMATYAYITEILSGEKSESPEGNELIDKAESMLLAQGYAKMRLVEAVGKEYLDDSMIIGGSDGIFFWRSSVLEENDEIDLILTYRVQPWFSLSQKTGMQFMKRCCIRGFMGYSNPKTSEGEGSICYITEEKDVYHTSPQCTHLKLSISGTAYEELERYRNGDGSKYKQCEKCIASGDTCDYVYIALQGEKYHSALSCSGLKRTVYAVEESQTEGRRKCSRCESND